MAITAFEVTAMLNFKTTKRVQIQTISDFRDMIQSTDFVGSKFIEVQKNIFQQNYAHGHLIQQVLDTVKGCDAKNITNLTNEYLQMTNLELIYMSNALLPTFARLPDYETCPYYVPHDVLVNIIQHPSKYKDQFRFTQIHMLVNDWIRYEPDLAWTVLIEGFELERMSYEDLVETLTPFLSPEQVTDFQFDFGFRLGWLIWICPKEYCMTVLKSYLTQLTEDKLPAIYALMRSLYFHPY